MSMASGGDLVTTTPRVITEQRGVSCEHSQAHLCKGQSVMGVRYLDRIGLTRAPRTTCSTPCTTSSTAGVTSLGGIG
jgi:hypothetical protein